MNCNDDVLSSLESNKRDKKVAINDIAISKDDGFVQLMIQRVKVRLLSSRNGAAKAQNYH